MPALDRPAPAPPPSPGDRAPAPKTRSQEVTDIRHDKSQRRVELSATVSEAVADAFGNAKALLTEGSDVVARDIAGPDSFLATTRA